MGLAISQSAPAVAPYCKAMFGATGGTSPYTFTVAAGGAGGSINASTGEYTAPAQTNFNPIKQYDTITVTDAASTTAQASIFVGTPLQLVCDIIQREMGLPTGNVYLWDQKLMQPNDGGLYVAVSVVSCKPFGNVNRFNGDTNRSEQFLAMSALLGFDIISRTPAARDRKEELLLALNSDYAERQMEANSFYIAKLPSGSQFTNLSDVDGAAIPYRFNISVRMQYSYAKSRAVPYYDEFNGPSIVSNP